MRALSIASLLGIFVTPTASSQIVVDYKLEILQSGAPHPGGEVGYALVITGNWSTNDEEPFVVQLTVPEGLEPGLQCVGGGGEVRFDAATRVLTWSHRMDNPYIAFNSCPLRFRIDPLVPSGTTFSLSAKLTMSKPDPNPSNDTAAVSTLVLTASDLEVKSSANRLKVKPGETIAYTLEVINHGPQTAQDVTLTDQLSGLVSFVSFEQTNGPPASLDAEPNPRDPDCFSRGCSGAIRARFAMLPAGSAATFRLVVVANTSFEAGNIRNRLFADSPAAVELAERNNLVEELVFAGPDADLAIVSELTDASTVLLRVSNDGPEAVHGVTVHSALATAVERWDFAELARFASVTASQGTCSAPVRDRNFGHPPPPDGWTVDCQIGGLAPGAFATITMVIEGGGAGPWRHFATVRPDQNDPRPNNNHAQVTSGAGRRRVARR